MTDLRKLREAVRKRLSDRMFALAYAISPARHTLCVTVMDYGDNTTTCRRWDCDATTWFRAVDTILEGGSSDWRRHYRAAILRAMEAEGRNGITSGITRL